MAIEGVTLNPGSGGDTAAADSVSGVKYQLIKLAYGYDGQAAFAPINDRHVSLGTSSDVRQIGSKGATAGVVFGVTAVNTSQTQNAYLHLYDVASAPTLGTTTPDATYPLLMEGGVSVSIPTGMIFDNGIWMAIASSVSGTGYVLVDTVVVNILYV